MSFKKDVGYFFIGLGLTIKERFYDVIVIGALLLDFLLFNFWINTTRKGKMNKQKNKGIK